MDIANFDARSLVDESKSSRQSQLDSSIERLKKLLKILPTLYLNEEDPNESIRKDIKESLSFALPKRLKVNKNEPLLKQAETFIYNLNNHGAFNIETIEKRFDVFGWNVWCPVMVEIIFEASMEELTHLVRENQLEKDQLSIYEILFRCLILLFEVRKFDNQENYKKIYKILRPCLQGWSKVLGKISQDQTKNLITTEKGAHNKLHKNLCQRYSQNIYTNVNDRNFALTLNDEQKELWSSSAQDFLILIVRECHQPWKRLQRMGSNPEDMISFGLDLFKEISLVFNQYFEGLIEVIMLDELFDNAEIVLSLECLHKSFEFTKEFEKNLKELVNILDENDVIDKDYGKLREFYDLLANSRDVKNEMAMNLIDIFCEKQREAFCVFIKVSC